ncbi:MAG: class I SAM-dependent methyltransferase [Candidatus Marinimicrobia bacterium]|nr:class I SAM-dependent methyltransferase [Candidatus Neomarinimicrobiota bacterium]
MNDYYVKNLSGAQLQKCYEIASPRIRQYLDAEIEFVCNKINSGDQLLELGCGYGRAMKYFLDKTDLVVGIDNSEENIRYAHEYLKGVFGWQVFVMNAIDLLFDDNSFDLVVCIQNGLSAFREDPVRIMSEALRVTKKGGVALFSTYSEKFWNERLKWFRDQAAHGLVGEIDEEKTGNGMIVCKDGFTARTFSRGDFHQCANKVEVDINLIEIDKSVLFCEIYKN